VRLVVREGMTLVAIGILLGIPIVFAAARLVEGLLFGVAPTDPPTLAATALVMLCTAALATYPAARRASRVDPMAALRTE
jgi:putative ABC transport system permease protein